MGKRTDVSKEDFIKELHRFYEVHGRTPRHAEFKGEWISNRWARKLFGGWNNAIKTAGLPTTQELPYSYTKEELLNQLLDYYKKYGKPPTQRSIREKGYAGHKAFYSHFGSFKNALIEAGLFDLREDKHQFCDEYTDEELLSFLEEYMKDKNRIPTYEAMKETLSPSISTFNKRFNGAMNAFKLIGYDIDTQKEDDLLELESDMLDKYKKLKEMLGFVPSSRDIERYSRNNGDGYAMKTYETHFGSLYNLQVLCGFIPTVIGRNKTKEDLINDLHRISDELGRTPSQLDLKYFEDVASSGKYSDVFGSWSKAVESAGLKPNSVIYYSEGGTECLSYYELIFVNMLEYYKMDFKKERLYRDYIQTDRLFRFDFVLNYNSEVYFVEIFGITENKSYIERISEKVELCNNNKLNLIAVYPNDFTSYKIDDTYEMFVQKINELKSNSKKLFA